LKVADATVEFLAERQRADSFGVTTGISKVTSIPAVGFLSRTWFGISIGVQRLAARSWRIVDMLIIFNFDYFNVRTLACIFLKSFAKSPWIQDPLKFRKSGVKPHFWKTPFKKKQIENFHPLVF
jgi:hypothetical protein